MKFCIVVPWHDENQKNKFLEAWEVSDIPDCLLLQQDSGWKSCAKTKNAGIRKAIDAGAEVVVVLDSDCYPCHDAKYFSLQTFAEAHIKSLEPQPVKIFQSVTKPASRGTPYFNRTITMPVAASMGFWDGVPDFDAPCQLVHGQDMKIVHCPRTIHGRYFALCGMNVAFRSEEWPWCQFVNVPRFDDIWAGWLWQKKAYAQGQCFNLNGPKVFHARQSKVFQNLIVESPNFERNETLWSDIATGPLHDHPGMLTRYGLEL